ncbi:Metallo-beta-lactamase superfamily protein [Ectopseudomonas composti]|uniref:Metallo-beta-lactamase superfamily protein n=1 Tax=Ectopseudomonas composti TaxID=658457 RepID=A0A1I5K1K8_9GAMM|nr:MBL fold metallo-hydrolase [Pseudomonas composti]SFO78922.1 Metallo-beta-lactamase superfamily protein [Pseudomonas composti]
MDVTMIQHPVGQGGLFSGQLQVGDSVLRWVYDCGSNQQDRLNEEILAVAAQGTIDLLFLSHLDSDHVSGVDRLLAATTVAEVVLPYLSATEFALIVAQNAATGALSGTFLEFVTDPAKWLIARGVSTVSFIHSVEENQQLAEWQLLESDGEGLSREDTSRLNVRWTQPVSKQRSVKHGTVQHFPTGAAVGVAANGQGLDWLLVPYAHKPSERRMQRFVNELKAVFGRALTRQAIARHARNEQGRAVLRECYDRLWLDHNKVSMSLYAGPQASPRIISQQQSYSHWRVGAPALSRAEVGWLMTGDAHLAAGRRLFALLNYYHHLRDRVSVLVLPHHGSELSFHPALVPGFSNLSTCIVAAGRNQYGHPHSHVYEQVRTYLGVQGWHHVSECPSSGFGVRAVL